MAPCKFILFLFMLCSYFVIINSFDVKGISTKDLNLYFDDNKEEFECFDKSKSIKKSMVNDDFCDCFDGSDEPGTSACSFTLVEFYCLNKGFISKKIPTSRVNDGICDCCDGSDEYFNQGIECKDQCKEYGASILNKIKEDLKVSKEGYLKRKERIDQVQQSLSLAVEQSDKIKQEITVMTNLKDKIITFKQIEEEKEHYLRWLDGQKGQCRELDSSTSLELETAQCQSGRAQHGTDECVTNMQKQMEEGSSGIINSFVCLNNGTKISLTNYLSQDLNSISIQPKEYLIKRSQETIHQLDKKKTDIKNVGIFTLQVLGIILSPLRFILNVVLTFFNGFKYSLYMFFWIPTPSLDFFSFIGPYVPTIWLENLVSMFQILWNSPTQLYQYLRPELDTSFKTPEAESLREILLQIDSELLKLKEKENKMKILLSTDYGTSKEFFSLSLSCIEKSLHHYMYKFCPFHNVTQNGLVIGEWKHWGKTENKEETIPTYTNMFYGNGASCWQGPSRSVRIELKCGLEDEIVSVEEPSTCLYIMQFRTPSACTAELVKLTEEKEKEWNIGS